MHSTIRPARLPAVTGVRFVAASHVVLYHYIPVFQLALAPWWVQNVVNTGYVAVDLFFILSGFVLAYTYLRPFEEPRIESWRFWIARFARIYPLYALTLVLSAPFWLHEFPAQHPGCPGAAATCLVANVLMVQAWLPRMATTVNFPAWSLSIEAFFYVTMPFLALPFARLRGRLIWLALGGLWLAALAAPVLYAVTNPDGVGIAQPAVYARWLRIITFNPSMRLPEFLMGITLAVLFMQRPRPRRAWTGPALTIVPAVAIVLVLACSSRIPFAMLHNGLLAPLFACLLYGLALGWGPIAWALARPWVVVLGDASYGIYLLQYPVWCIIVYAAMFVAPAWTGNPWSFYWAHPGLVFVVLPVLLGVSVILYFAYQEPARRWLIRRLGTRRPAPMPEPAVSAATAGGE